MLRLDGIVGINLRRRVRFVTLYRRRIRSIGQATVNPMFTLADFKGGIAYGYELSAYQLSYLEQVTIPRYPKQESNRVADIANNQLHGQWWVIDVQITTPPGQQAICETE